MGEIEVGVVPVAMIEPKTFEDLKLLQKTLDENTGKKRDNGFIPRERDGIDILLSLDDEFQEWLRELPEEVNFKTWKQKKYNREKELEEFTDILFFFLQLVNNINRYNCKDINPKCFNKIFDDFSDFNRVRFYSYKNYQRKEDLIYLIETFKRKLWKGDFIECFEFYISIAMNRDFLQQEIIDMYYEKWQKNMERIKGDWTK